MDASDDRGVAYEVEVRTADDTEWNVDLDAEFKVRPQGDRPLTHPLTRQSESGRPLDTPCGPVVGTVRAPGDPAGGHPPDP